MDATDRRRQWLRRSTLLALACAALAPIAGLIFALPLRILVYPDLPVNQLNDGRMWIFVTLPALMVIGAAIGFGLGCIWSKKDWAGMLVLSIVPVVMMEAIRGPWLARVANFGRDATEVHLFYCPLVLAGLAVAMAILVGLSMIGRVVTDHLRSTEET